MPMCPNGHQSTDDDWCEICGMRMAAPPAPPYGSRPASASSSSSPASTPPHSLSPPGFAEEPSSGAELCPQCGTPREGVAMFCEECRYNFRTHAATVVATPLSPGPSAPQAPPTGHAPAAGPAPTGGPSFPPYPQYESNFSRPSQINRPAEPVPSESVTVTSGSGDYLIGPPSTPLPPRTTGGTAAEASEQPGAGPSTAWVAVIGADREYFTAMMARSGPEGQGLYFPAFSPEIQLPLTGDQITIGRRRQSTGEAPDIDLARSPEDPGVSHKHAILVPQPDGSWSVVDQDSTNGTTVNLGEDPIRPYTPVPLEEGDRVHVGAWTTITLRRA
ncbi:Forkhead associated (FHA) domain, binds pSer, pThr, pTyr [Streptomyces sp. DvalAA-14]|uniref:FHA domain-containing protein n=1 Tax=unclassified Streptomyces TaxID=2593676 RepID=UPI00081BAEB4|nr:MULTISPECIES: FHA domain-containing protein [unclassified Streptomyces]MYS19686.1 FHA domain-containing protein [Streptomyces sp. SID4948]SCD50640.1 Forkhead associated (FHA) domain, binds pSer, pThr, pTyr [Streptomyces sp. DvalAA-14]